MEMEQLNKSQLVLLTLLVSFVTSIATGIVTVALMQQAPPAITQTVSKVIERTVERVVPGQAASVAVAQAAPVTKTVYVSQSDTVAEAVTKVSDSIVRLTTTDKESPVFLALGIVLDAEGTIATDEASLGEAVDAVVTLPAGASQRMFVVARDGHGIAYLAPATSSEQRIVWTPITFAPARTTLGSTAIVIGGKMSTRVSQGIVTGFQSLSASAASSSPRVIETDVSEASILPGAPLIDSSGALLGLSSGSARLVAKQGFISSSAIVVPKY